MACQFILTEVLRDLARTQPDPKKYLSQAFDRVMSRLDQWPVEEHKKIDAYVQEGVEKRAQTAAALRWELIGHLQSNKTRLAVAHFDRVQSVDSEKLLTVLNRAAGELGRKMPVLLQINAGNDPAKFGTEPADAPRLLEAALSLPHLQVDGLMTIAPLSNDPAVARQTFANLRRIRDELAARCGTPLRELSMGMSGDFDPAIAEGSTLIRVGSALYGPR